MFTIKPPEVWPSGLESIREEVEACAADAAAMGRSSSSDSLGSASSGPRSPESGEGFHRRQSTLDLFSLQTPAEETLFHRAREHKLGHIAREMRARDGGVSVQARLRGLRQYDACFVGLEAVDWLVAHRYAQTRVEAVMLGNDLMDAGHFHHVADKTDNVERRLKYAFRDSPDEFYRFYVHEVEQPNQIQKRMEKREKLKQKHRRTRSDVSSLRSSDTPLFSTPSHQTSHHGSLNISDSSSSARVDSTDQRSASSPLLSESSFDSHGTHDGLRSSGDDNKGSLSTRVKSKVRQVMGEKLRSPWIEKMCPVLEGQSGADVEQLVWGVQKVDDTPLEIMELLSNINTLHKGDPLRANGTSYMVGLDGTDASKRAFQMLVSHILKPSDFVYIVAIRERKMPDRLAMHSRNSEERLKWQFDLWRVARKILRPAHKQLLARQIEHSALTPKSSDARKKLLRLARQYRANTIVLGKHAKGESSPLSAVQGHFRKMTAFATKHVKGDPKVEVLIF